MGTAVHGLFTGTTSVDSWDPVPTRRAALAVALAAEDLHKGGFTGSLIPMALWRDAIAQEWERQGQRARAAATRAVVWLPTTSARA